jgi:hypothetical protein
LPRQAFLFFNNVHLIEHTTSRVSRNEIFKMNRKKTRKEEIENERNLGAFKNKYVRR